jgi:hypothetical protein
MRAKAPQAENPTTAAALKGATRSIATRRLDGARRRVRAARNWWPFTLAHLTEFGTLAMNECANVDAE